MAPAAATYEPRDPSSTVLYKVIADHLETFIADVVQTISRRVIRKLRHLGYLEAGSNDAVATGYDPLLSAEPELARIMAASVTPRSAFGERAGQQVQRMGAGFGSAGEHPTLTGTRCACVNGFSLHANTQVPAHRRGQLERFLPLYGPGCGDAGAPPGRCRRRSHLYVHQAVVRRDDGHHPRAVGTA